MSRRSTNGENPRMESLGCPQARRLPGGSHPVALVELTTVGPIRRPRIQRGQPVRRLSDVKLALLHYEVLSGEFGMVRFLVRLL